MFAPQNDNEPPAEAEGSIRAHGPYGRQHKWTIRPTLGIMISPWLGYPTAIQTGPTPRDMKPITRAVASVRSYSRPAI